MKAVIKCILPLICLMIIRLPVIADTTDSSITHSTKHKNVFDLQKAFTGFYPLRGDAVYTITACADLPVNDRPECVFKKGEPGHVFLILSMNDTIAGRIIQRSFGFYPRVPVSCIIKKVRSKIMDNSNREYDAAVSKQLTAAEFELVLDRCKTLARKKYNLKKYNCYDYVLEVFNALPCIEKLPVTTVKFPFIFGWGGSPCALYSDLKKLLNSESTWAACIKFGLFRSPPAESDQHLTAQF